MRVVLVVLLLALTACSSSEPAAPSDPVVAPDSWLGMAPGDAREFHGPGGTLILIAVDETYSIDGENTSALTWELGDRYTTDYYVQDDSPRVRELPRIDPRTVQATVIGGRDLCCDPIPVEYPVLDRKLYEERDAGRPGPLVKVTIAGGEVTRVDEVFLP